MKNTKVGSSGVNRPRHTAVFLIEHVAGAYIFLDDNHAAIRAQDSLTSLQVGDDLGILQVTQTPLRPDNVVLGSGLWLPVLKPDVEDCANSGLTVEGVGEFGNGLDNIYLVGYL